MRPINKTLHGLLEEKMHGGQNKIVRMKRFIVLQKVSYFMLCTESMFYALGSMFLRFAKGLCLMFCIESVFW